MTRAMRDFFNVDEHSGLGMSSDVRALLAGLHREGRLGQFVSVLGAADAAKSSSWTSSVPWAGIANIAAPWAELGLRQGGLAPASPPPPPPPKPAKPSTPWGTYALVGGGVVVGLGVLALVLRRRR